MMWLRKYESGCSNTQVTLLFFFPNSVEGSLSAQPTLKDKESCSISLKDVAGTTRLPTDLQNYKYILHDIFREELKLKWISGC